MSWVGKMKEGEGRGEGRGGGKKGERKRENKRISFGEEVAPGPVV